MTNVLTQKKCPKCGRRMEYAYHRKTGREFLLHSYPLAVLWDDRPIPCKNSIEITGAKIS